MLELVIGSGAFLALLYWVFGGYPARRQGLERLGAKETCIVATAADSLFPPYGPIPVSGSQANIVEFMDHQLGQMPKDKRVLIRLLFAFVEHSPWLFGPFWPRFTRMRLERRQLWLHKMSHHRVYFLRLSFLSLRSLLCFGYFADSKVQEALNAQPNARPFE